MDTYYSERRAVSREMRRASARRNMTFAAAVCFVLVAVALAAVALVGVADAGDAEQSETIVTDTERTESIRDDYPVLGTIIPPPKKPDKPEKNYMESELEMLALAIYQEAGGDACSDSTRRMVAEVVLNRIGHPMYPDTMEGVLLQRGQYGELHWTGLVWPKRAQHESEQHAVERAYRIAKDALTSDYRLLPGDVLFQAGFPQGSEIVVEQDGFYFCR